MNLEESEATSARIISPGIQTDVFCPKCLKEKLHLNAGLAQIREIVSQQGTRPLNTTEARGRGGHTAKALPCPRRDSGSICSLSISQNV